MYKKLLIALLFLSFNLKADYVGIELKKYAAIVATQNKINLVLDKKLNQELTIFINTELSSRSSLSIFKDMLEINGLDLVQKSQYFLVKEKEISKVDKFKIYTIKGNTKELKETLFKFLLSFDSRAKKIQKTTTPVNIPIIQNDTTKTNNYGNKFNTKSSKSVYRQDNRSTLNSVQTTNFSIIEHNSNTLILTYKKPITEILATNLIKQIDHQPKQITLKAEILEVDTNRLSQLGFNFGAVGQKKTNTKDISLALGNSQAILTQDTQAKLTGFIKANLEDGNITVKSTPLLTILEGKKQVFEQTQSVTFIKEDTTTTNQSTVNSSIKEIVQIGNIFSVEFTKYQNNNFYLDIDFKLQTPTKTDPNNIQFSSRNITTNIRLKQNERVIIAGTGKETIGQTVNGVPLFIDIPWIGSLFKTNSKQKINTTIIITLWIEEVK